MNRSDAMTNVIERPWMNKEVQSSHMKGVVTRNQYGKEESICRVESLSVGQREVTLFIAGGTLYRVEGINSTGQRRNTETLRYRVNTSQSIARMQ